ncbi:hypothetical protein APR41_03085 [Salegentibacter salinarum]|uniref:Curli assembly protein CsgC n=1 Tax=Salegentibacter salinarum TaxID=447422 RepID=A0A2N0TXX3_9FLAO|nr:curli-like amyloid fiber formation chaperone CsgH [Salegentibacter salinarum]PKD19605.1 hypothetical protein APR41_03085 [Salegentibacter salinarum]SKB42275.1 hypothetical protein SAMN05660903_00630 [Salegentibacter salinarum]
MKFSMKDYLSIPTIFLMFFCVSTSFSQDHKEQNIEAKIKLDNKDRFLNISGEAINNTSEDYQLRYKLSVVTGGEQHSNSSQNNQSGSFLLPSSDTKILSRTSISQNPGNRAEIHLHIMDKDKVVARDSITFQF